MVFDVVKRALLAGLGVQQSVQSFLDDLVKKGELNESDAAKLLKDWINKTEESAQELEKKINERISKTLSAMNLPSRQDISRLEKQIEDLSKLLRASRS
ncbi:MAG TPA: phasin family protein [Methylomirabilota bacterium]|jgi:polyhydroxyalkanoate synthesis regulator phasin|nr:phasin family protein [Methylomirabilota bacterium]